MLTSDQIEALGDQAQQIISPVVDYLIEDIARRVSQAGQLTATASYQVWRVQNLGVSQYELKQELKKRLNVSEQEIQNLLKQAAKTGYNYDLNRLPTARAIPFEENGSLQQIVSAFVGMAGEDLSNLTRTIGFVGPDGQARELTQAYQQACDYAFQKVATGAQDYNSAIREATRNLVKRGIVTIDYESGVHTSLEAAVRRNIMGGLGLMQEQISRQNHDDLGCDGWEISAHSASAPDHEPIQGKQYSDAEYEKLNNALVRRIGTLNCGHSASPIILGVSQPQYTDAELDEMRRENEKGIDYNGRHYTMYEATQRQRQLERSIRRQKRKILIDEAAGDKDKLQTDQIRYQVLDQEYRRFSKAARLRLQHERMEMTGFGPKQARAAEKAAVDYEKNLQFIRDDATIKAASGFPKTIQGPDTSLAHTVNVNLPKIQGVVPKGSAATEVYTMAGNGTSTPIRDLQRLYSEYPEYGDASGWKKKSGTVYSEYHHYVVHWYENTGGVPPDEIKLKGAK